ncbi:MAG: hypothetical protein ABIQ32_06660 [Sphingomicrobium sp.]
MSAIIVAGVGGTVLAMRRGVASIRWSIAGLLIAVIANYPVLEFANARDPEAGPMGLLIVGTLAFLSLFFIGLGTLLGEIAVRGARRSSRK